MSYILGSIVVLMAAYIASIQGEIKHYKTRIKSLNSRIGELLRENLRGQEDNEKLSQEIENLNKQIRIGEGIRTEMRTKSNELSAIINILSLQEIPDDKLNRWDQLVADCKKPFTKTKQPINCGGKFTRESIIAIGNLIDMVKEFTGR
jgi:predicted RNase H-like nuclease (RuvC/YqgF family)